MTALIVPAVAEAQQQQTAQSSAIEEIIVTSRKREESLQEIPVSVTAFSAIAMERAGFVDLEDIAGQTTGFQFNNELSATRPGRLFSNMRFRGIESATLSSTQPASLFIDGVYALQGAQAISLMDLERVEIIKGPQAAQFGRNSFSGAVNYITTTPSLDEYKGKVQAEGATYDSYELQASHEGPLAENKLAYRLSARLFQKGSMFTATDGGPMGEQSTKAVSGQLYGKPSDNWDLKARVFYQRDNDGPAANAYMQGRLNDTCTGQTVTIDGVARRPVRFICGDVPSPGQAGAPKVTANTSLFPASPAFTGANANFLVARLINFPQVAGVPKMEGFGLEREMFRASISSDYEFANGISMSVIAAYNENRANDLRDWDMTDLPGNNRWYVTNPMRGTDKSIDARIQSSSEDRFRWLAGANYYDQSFRTSGNGGVFATECANFAGTNEATACSTPGLFPVGLDGNDFVDAWSVYGSASYDITEQFTIDLEARYLNDERSDGNVVPALGRVFTETYKQFLPRVSLNFKPVEDVNIYGNYSRGELPGLINSNIIGCSPTTYTATFIDPRTGRPSSSSECQQYQEALGALNNVTPTQTLDAFEVGLKSTLLDGRATANIAVYKYKWKNQPFGTFVTIFRDDNGDRIPNTNPNFFPVFAPGSSKLSGVEFDGTIVPVDGWTIQAAMTYNKNRFTRFNAVTGADIATLGAAPNTNVSLAGNRASRFPKWSGNIASTYTTEFNNDFDWFLRGDVVYNGRHVTGTTNLATVKPWTLVNLRTGLESDGARFEFFVKNLFNTKRWAAGQEFTDFTVRFPLFNFSNSGLILIPQDKRQFGVRTSLDF